MPSQELQRIIRDLSQFGDTITISAIKNSIQFRYSRDIKKFLYIFAVSSDGGLGTGNIKLMQTSTQVSRESYTVHCGR